MKKFKKKLISMLLAASMICGINVSIYAETTAETQTGTESISAETDKYYQTSIGLLSYLKIFEGYEDGSMKPETKITRAEMAAIILRMLKIEQYSEYKGGFSDVDESHWAADVIQTAYENNIISGMGDGTFEPDETVTYEQAITMIVRTMNYGSFAENDGGYPMGYIRTASRKDLDKNVKGSVGEEITRQSVAKLAYNALIAPYPIISGLTNGYNNYVNFEYKETEGVTLLTEKFDIYYTDGLITGTHNKTIDLSTSLDENQIKIEDTVMNSTIEDADSFVATYCRVFYLDKDGIGNEMTAVYAVPIDSKNNIVEIQADDIDSIVTGYDGGTPSIKYYKDGGSLKNLKLNDSPIIVYNDSPITLANYNNLGIENLTFDEFITPDAGNIRLVDFGKDGKYDLIFVEKYEVSVVKLATVSRLQLKYPISIGDIINVDTTKDDSLSLNVTKNEEKTDLRNLAEGDIVSIKMSANFNDSTYTGNKSISIEAGTEYVEGKLSSMSGSSNNHKSTVVIDGDKFECVNNEDIIADLKKAVGKNGKFYLDKFGRVAYVDTSIISNLSGGEKYGWIVNLYKEESGDIAVTLYTQDAEMINCSLASNVTFWGCDDVSSSKKSAEEIAEIVNGNGSKGFLMCNTVDKKGDITGQTAMKLCKYKVNSNNNITKLYLAVDQDLVDEHSDALRVDTKDHRNDNESSSLFAGKYLIENAIPQFSVPLDAKDRNDTSLYKYRMESDEEFNKKGDTKLGYNCFLADISDYKPSLSVRLVAGANDAVSIDEYSTADDNRVMVVSDISSSINDDDEPIYIINGICNGEEVEYTTTQNTILANVNPAVRKDKETYDTTTVWTGASKESLSDVLHKGDICGIDGSSAGVGIILRMVDSTALADYLNAGGTVGKVPDTQFFKDEMFSASRDRVIFGYVTGIRTSPILQLSIAVDSSTSGTEDDDVTDDGSPLISMGIKDYSTAVTIINVSSNGRITVDNEITDVYEIMEGDYVFMRRFKNDAMREIYVIRYE